MDDETIGAPLSGLRVIDATSGIAGPVATMLLADFGAQVIRLEGELNTAGSDLAGAPMWHRNKTVIPFERADDLLQDADVLVTTDATVADSLAVPLENEIERGIVHLHLPAWREDSLLDPITMDRMMQAEYGIARRQTSFSGGPVDGIYPFASYLQGTWAAAAGIAALIELVRTGIGQRTIVDPFHGAIVAATTTMFTDPKVSLPSTTVGPGGPNPAFGTYQCADGAWLFLGALGAKFQDIAFDLIGASDVIEHPRIAANREEIFAVDLRDEVRSRIAAGFRTKNREAWLTEFAEAGCPASPVGSRDEWLDHPQVAALNQRVEMDDPAVGRVVSGGNPVQFSKGPISIAPRAFADAASWSPRPPSWSDAPTAHRPINSISGPLDGLRVLNLGTVLAGPYAGQLLSSLGADVIKVETPKGDEFRVRGYMINRGQRNISIDLRNSRGHDAFLTLVAESDVVLDNFRPGVSSRLGIDLLSLQKVNPDIITTSITGYGGVGPLGMLPGYDPVVQALTGIMDAQGGDDEPVFSTVAVNDVTVAALAALGTLAALFDVAVGRGGQAVSSSLVASSTFVQSNELVRYQGRPAAERGGRDYPGPSATSRYYGCADGWVRVHLDSPDTAAAAGLIDETPSDDQELAARIADALDRVPSDEISAILEPLGATVARGRDNKALLFDPVSQEDGHIGKVTWPDGNETFMPRQYAAFSRHETPPMMTTAGMGEHTREVLLASGLSSAEVDALIRDGVVVQGTPLHSVAGTGYR